MFIKKVIVNWPGGNRYPSLRILFYDQDGNLFESGSTISSTTTTAETDNFIVTSLMRSYGDAYNPINAISTEVHKDIDTYIGQKISFIGYVYKADGFSKNQFVLARDMDIGNNQTLIVGFLCDYEKAQELELKSWIKITGEITKGEYNRFYNSYNPYNIFREFF